MKRFCTKCGSALDENGQCPNCHSSEVDETFLQDTVKKAVNSADSFVVKLKRQMGLGWENETGLNVFEKGQNIIPDNVTPDEGEVPIRQYNVATLCSRIQQKRAEGRLQITNKRLIFRAAGISLAGNTVLQHEFTIDEISGLEIRKSHRLSFVSVVAAFWLAVTCNELAGKIINPLVNISADFAAIIALILALIFIAPFFIVKGHFWLKLASTAIASSAIGAVNRFSIQGLIMGTAQLFTLPNTLEVIIDFIILINIMLVAFVPDLTLCIKAGSGSDAIQIRRKIWGLWLKNPDENSGFSEVRPGPDAEKAAKEVGALISDLQVMGDEAIEKWKM